MEKEGWIPQLNEAAVCCLVLITIGEWTSFTALVNAVSLRAVEYFFYSSTDFSYIKENS